MTITTKGARYHVGTLAELRQLLAALAAAGSAVQGIELQPRQCWYCDQPTIGPSGSCQRCSRAQLTPADWGVHHGAA